MQSCVVSLINNSYEKGTNYTDLNTLFIDTFIYKCLYDFSSEKTIQMTNFLSFFQINRFHAEKQMKQEEQRKKDMERLVELRREIEEQVQRDKER